MESLLASTTIRLGLVSATLCWIGSGRAHVCLSSLSGAMKMDCYIMIGWIYTLHGKRWRNKLGGVGDQEQDVCLLRRGTGQGCERK
jgi:hypothetical protein